MRYSAKGFGLCLLAAALPAYGATPEGWQQIHSTERGFTFSMPCKPGQEASRKNEPLFVRTCTDPGTFDYWAVASNGKDVAGDQTIRNSYDRFLSDIASKVGPGGYAEPIKSTIDGRRAFSTREWRSTGLIFHQVIELNGGNILIMSVGCQFRRGASCFDLKMQEIMANQFFGTVRLLKR